MLSTALGAVRLPAPGKLFPDRGHALQEREKRNGAVTFADRHNRSRTCSLDMVDAMSKLSDLFLAAAVSTDHGTREQRSR